MRHLIVLLLLGVGGCKYMPGETVYHKRTGERLTVIEDNWMYAVEDDDGKVSYVYGEQLSTSKPDQAEKE